MYINKIIIIKEGYKVKLFLKRNHNQILGQKNKIKSQNQHKLKIHHFLKPNSILNKIKAQNIKNNIKLNQKIHKVQNHQILKI